MFSRVGYVDGREWAALVAAACALVLAVVLAVACLVKAVEVAGAWRERERVEWSWDESRSTSAAPELGAAYPDPVCEWCGGIMDGHSCQCEGGGL